jgi:hypothetical protein
MEEVRRHFEANARRGVVLSASQLASFAKKRGLPNTPLAKLRQVRHGFKFSAFASRYTRPLRYMSSSLMIYGSVQVDMANFSPEHRRVNGGHAAFLLGVEGVSGQLAVVPCKDLTTKSWERAIRIMMETSSFNSVRVFMSDRDSAVKSDDASKGLRARLKRDYGVGWYFMRGRHKAFRAER